MKYILLIALFFFAYPFAYAQTNNAGVKGKITGKVTDANDKTPVEYATIAIYKEGSKTPINGSTTDTKGDFTINNLSFGEYQIAVDFIGYQHYIIDHVIISAAKANVVLNNISIVPVKRELNSVTVTAKVATVENKIDKMVYNPANDLTSQGGVATDVLQKVPMVTVDIDGNVSLQGNSNVRFLINGKPSSIFGASLSDALQSIPASQIKSIEVITSPGAKYDAEGTGGIINIILKDSKIQGVNGSVNATAGTRLENGSFNINARKGNFGAGAYFSGNERINSTTVNTNDKSSYNAKMDSLAHLYQVGNSALTRSGYQTGLNLTWTVTPKDELNASFGFNHFGRQNNGLTNTDQQTTYGPTFTDLMSNLNSYNKFKSNSSDYSLSYKKTFAKDGQELDVLYSSSYSNNTDYFTQATQYLNSSQKPSGSIANNPGTDNQTNVSIDYTQPVTKTFTIETGAKAIFETLSNSVLTDTLLNNGDYGLNAHQTYSFNYTRNIYAAYLSLTFTLFNDFINGKAGLRYERTDTQADFQGVSIPSYNTFAPSFVLSHKIDDSQSIKASFTYRLQRPGYNDLDPFYNISDPHNISTGNPYLTPELGHNFELGYNKTFDGGANIYFAGFYRYNTDDIQSFTTSYPNIVIEGTNYPNVSLTQRFNLGTEASTGASIFGSIPATDKLSFRSNMFFMDRISKEPGLPTTSGFGYRINFNASYTFPKSLVVEAFGNYNSSQTTIQGKSPAFATYNIAMRKLFWNKKASLGLTTTDPFSQYLEQKNITSAANFNQTSIRQVPFRSFGISLSYKFGKLEFKKDKDSKDNKDNGDEDKDNPNTVPQTPPAGQQQGKQSNNKP